MGQGFLMDSNAVIDFFNGKLPPGGKLLIAANTPEISVITHIELLSNKNIPINEWNQLQQFVKVAVIHNIDNKIVQQTILLRQQYKIKTPDAIIAATALILDFDLISRNTDDFKNIIGLMVINPYLI